MIKATQRGRCLVKTLLAGTVMAVLMAATAFAATTPPIRSGEYKVPARDGYEFQGWTLDPEGAGDIVIDKDGNWLSDLSDDTEVYAKWKMIRAILLPGTEFNSKIKKLNNRSVGTIYNWTVDRTVKTFTRSNTLPADIGEMLRMGYAVDISAEGSTAPIYAWGSGTTVYWYSDDDVVEMNEDSKCMFQAFNVIENIDLNGITAAYAKNMNSMFKDTVALRSLDLTMFNTSSATNMANMFNGSHVASLDLSHFNTSNVTDMREMFSGCIFLTELNTSGWDTSKVTNMYGMFNNANKLSSIDTSSWDTSSVDNMAFMFKGCKMLTSVDFSQKNMSNVSNMADMFNGCAALEEAKLTKCSTIDNVTDITALFAGCRKLQKIDLSMFGEGSRIIKMDRVFSGCSLLKDVNLTTLNTQEAFTMKSMFMNCNALKDLDLSALKTRNWQYCNDMFNGCANLERIYVSERWYNTSDHSTFYAVTSSGMFSGCRKLPNFSSSYTDCSRANYKYDGYLTYKAAPTTP